MDNSLFYKDLKLGTYCDKCPYAELIIIKITAERTGDQELSIHCNHERACERIARLCGVML